MKISIIIPVYNVEKYIGRCLDSILNQTFQDFEIIAVDDCGSDSSIEIVKEYVSKDARVRLIQQEKNMGPMVARQVGYNQASGDYIFFCDSDDTLPKDSLQLLYSAAIESNADIVNGHIKTITDGSNSKLWRIEHLDYGTDKISVYKSLLKGEISHNLCAKIYKKDLLTSYNYKTIPNMRNGEDAMLFYQIVDNCSKVVCIDEVVYNYIQHPSSSTHIQISEDNIEKLILWRCFLYDDFISKYHEVENLGYSATIRVISSVWYEYPYYGTRKLINKLRQNNVSHLFCINQVYSHMGIKGLFDIFVVAPVKYLKNYVKFIKQN